jgi:protein-disulfide isomerase
VRSIEPVIIQNYIETGKVYYSYAALPVVDTIDDTDASRRAANAALCASAQNKFWEYHDTLYANQVTESADLFSDARLVKMAQNIRLDMEAFSQCYQAKKYDPDIVNSGDDAVRLGLGGTPSILVNGLLVDKWSNTVQVIEQALAGY